jgi:phosphatidylglycerophosphatase A
VTAAGARDRIAHVLAVWFGCGHVPRAPGTAGTVGAIPLFLAVRPHGLAATVLAAALVTVIGVWASGIVAARLGQHDPQIVCIDEVAGVLVTLLAAPFTPAGIVAGFVCFRVFDHTKPWPAGPAERLPGGWGVMVDDLVAGVWGAGVMLILRQVAGWR